MAARVLEVEGDEDGAFRAYEAAAKLSPEEATPNVAIARMRLRQGHPDDAVEWASRTHAGRSDDISSALVLVDALVAQHNTARAEQETRKAMERWPRVPALYVRLAAVNFDGGRTAQARQALEDALRIDPDSTDAMTFLTAMDIREGHGRDAMSRIAARLRAHPSDSSLLLLSARTSAATGHSDQAETTLTRLIDQDPARLDAYAALGGLYVQQGRLEEARAQFDRLALHSPNPSAATMVGMILESQHLTDAARRQYEDTLTRFPRAGVAANNLACLYARDGRLDEALKLARVASEELRRRPEANDTLGWIYLERHDASNAVAPLAAAVEAQPDNPTYRYHLGAAYAQTGAVASAHDELRRALNSKLPFADRAAAKKLFDETAAAR
jgi:tetratricopeptide (TPR) repeat protein